MNAVQVDKLFIGKCFILPHFFAKLYVLANGYLYEKADRIFFLRLATN